MPPAPPCLHRQRLMPHVVSIFASQDIWEIPREKTVAYAQALQYLMEQNNLPKRDQPCLLAESIAELRREVGFYLSFTDEEVFQGIDLPKEEGSNPSVPTATTIDAPGATDTPEAPPIPKVAPKYARWDTGSTPILTCGSHRGDPQADCYAEDKEKSPSTHPNYFHMPTIQPPKGSIMTKVSPTSQSTGISKAAHTTSWLCQGNHLFKNTGTCGGRPGDTCGHYVHRNGIEPQPFEH